MARWGLRSRTRSRIPAQLFDGDTAPGALRLGHDALGNLMVDVGGKTGLFAAPFS